MQWAASMAKNWAFFGLSARWNPDSSMSSPGLHFHAMAMAERIFRSTALQVVP